MKFFGQKKNKKGFTLIEIMVAVSIFSIVMVISMGALLSIINVNRKSQSVKTIMNNLSFALEEMAKNIRFGTSYYCSNAITGVNVLSSGNNCQNGGTNIAFNFTGVRVTNQIISYFAAPKSASDQAIGNCPSGTLSIYRTIATGGSFDASGATGIGVSAPEACITNLSFAVTGQTSGDKTQPRVLITLNGYAGTGNTKTAFNLQTTVSERQLDVGP